MGLKLWSSPYDPNTCGETGRFYGEPYKNRAGNIINNGEGENSGPLNFIENTSFLYKDKICRYKIQHYEGAGEHDYILINLEEAENVEFMVT